MKTVVLLLTQGLTTTLNEEDLEKVLAYNESWFALKSRYTFYAYAKSKVRWISATERYSMPMHRLIMQPPKDKLVDHKDRNGLNNIRDNLRIVDDFGNAQNKRKYKNNASGTPGVFHLITPRGRKFWHAQFTKNGRQRFLGRFLTKDEAIAARLEAENDSNN